MLLELIKATGIGSLIGVVIGAWLTRQAQVYSRVLGEHWAMAELPTTIEWSAA